MSLVTHLECANCGASYAAGEVHNLCTACGKPLWVRYDLEAVQRRLHKRDLADRPATLWRFLELLPVSDAAHIVSLGETVTPILAAPRLAAHFGMSALLIKDESRLPTGSFKARGMALAVTMAKRFGLKRLAVPTAGNAGGAMAAYAARAGMESWVFMPEDTPAINKKECHLAGARTYTVNGLIDDCGSLVAKGEKEKGWFNVATLKEPYRIEGKKTMGLELAEQLEWELPDVILYPTGGGTGLIGMWKAFGELEQMGWLNSSRKPRMIACQSTGCAPIVSAFRQGKRFAERCDNASTVASGIRVPSAVGDFMIIDAIRESGGVAVAAPEEGIATWMRLAASTDGIAICPETAVCLGVLEQLLESGDVGRDERVVVFNTGAAQKYPEAVEEQLPAIDLAKPIPWDAI
jgi:threonine synthase